MRWGSWVSSKEQALCPFRGGASFARHDHGDGYKVLDLHGFAPTIWVYLVLSFTGGISTGLYGGIFEVAWVST